MSAVDTLLVERAPGQTRVAALSGETVVEFHHVRRDMPAVGAIFCGRVRKILPGSKACFVDIGLSQDALMPFRGRPPNEGELVQARIVQPPRGHKGAKLAPVNDPKTLPDEIGAFSTSPGLLVAAPHPVSWCAEKYADTLKKVIVSPNDPQREVVSLIHEGANIELSVDSGNIFTQFGVDDALDEALDREVPLPGGGRVIIEPTAALTAIDIDAGAQRPTDANAQAISVIAQQIRLRSIGGPMIVDLIPESDRGRLVDRLRAAVAGDPVKTQVSGLTPEGRLELNRVRERPALSDLYLSETLRPGPSVDAIVYDILREAVRLAFSAAAARIAVTAHPTVITALQGRLRHALDDAEHTLKTALHLESGPRSRMDDFDIRTD